MINGIDAGASYRNRYTAGAFSTRETTGTPETEQTGGQSWDAVFTDKADNGVSVDDFLNLMVAQLQNQDFMIRWTIPSMSLSLHSLPPCSRCRNWPLT